MSTDEEKLEKYEEVVRMMLRHEDELVNHRMTWFTTLQGFLFAALVFMWGKPFFKLFVSAIGVMGIVVCLLCLALLSGATQAMARLRADASKRIKVYNEHAKEAFITPGVVGLEPPCDGKWEFLVAWNVIPAVFAVLWVLFLCWLWFLYPSTTPKPRDAAANRKVASISLSDKGATDLTHTPHGCAPLQLVAR